MSTIAAQESWFAGAVGRSMNPDGVYGLQCVDPYIDYALALFGRFGGQDVVAGRHNANGLFDAAPGKYWEKILEVPGDPTSIPRRGDVIIWKGNANNEFGHIAVVSQADPMTDRVVQQDGFLQVPAHVAVLGYDNPGTGPVLGWLRPRLELLTLDVGPTQRVVGTAGANGRKEPNAGAEVSQRFKPGGLLNFKGYVHGATVSGSDVWFVGAISGVYVHASALDGGNTTQGLIDLTPKPAPAKPARNADQRYVGAQGAVLRDAPNKNAGIVQRFNPGDLLNFIGYVRAERPYGTTSSDIWFVGISGNYVHSSALDEGDTTNGLKDLTQATPTPPSVPGAPNPPAPVEVYAFAKRWKCVTSVEPAHISNLQRGNFPENPTHLVIHQADELGKSLTLRNNIVGWFKVAVGTGGRTQPTSAHFGADDDEFVATVDTVDRAFHAGSIGNNFLSVELLPNPSQKAIRRVIDFMNEWEQVKGYRLIPTLHKGVPGNNTNCGTNIPLDAITLAPKAGVEVITDTKPAPTPVLSDQHDVTAVRSFTDFLVNLWRGSKK